MPRLLCLLALWVAAFTAAAAQTRTGLSIVAAVSAPQRGWVLVLERETRSVLALNAQTLATERSYPLDTAANPDLWPFELELGADGAQVFVVTGLPAGIVVIDLDSGASRTLTLDENGTSPAPLDLVESAPGRAFVATNDDKAPAEIDLATGVVLRRLEGPGYARRLVLDRDHRRLFARGYFGLTRFDLDGIESPLTKTQQSDRPVSLAPDGQTLWVNGVLTAADTFSAIDAPPFDGLGYGDAGIFGSVDGRAYLPRAYIRGARGVGVVSLPSLAMEGHIRDGCALSFEASHYNLIEAPDGNGLVAWDKQGICVFAKTVQPLPAPGNKPGGQIADVLVDRARLWLAVPERNEVVLLRRDKLDVMRRLSVPGRPTRLVLSADKRRVFVTLAFGSGIAVIDRATLDVDIQRYDFPDDTNGLSDAALMADGRLLALDPLSNRMAVIETTPGYALRWLDLPAEARPYSLTFDAVRAYAYLPGFSNGNVLQRLELADLDNVKLTTFSRLRNGRPLLAHDAYKFSLSANGERMETNTGQVFNPLTRTQVRDFERARIGHLGADNDTYFATQLSAHSSSRTVERIALSSGKTLSTTRLLCAPSRLLYTPHGKQIIGIRDSQVCTDRAATGITPSTRPTSPERIPAPNLLQPLGVGTRLVYDQLGTRFDLRVDGSELRGMPRHVVRVNSLQGTPEFYSSTPEILGLHGFKDLENQVELVIDPPIVLLDADDGPRSRASDRGAGKMYNELRQYVWVNYQFRRELKGYQQVTVPAGTFRALKVDYQLRLFTNRIALDQTLVWSSWYVPGLGSIKELHRGRPAFNLRVIPAVDPDRDGLPFRRDNCPLLRTRNVSDFDRDGAGDACDTDDDADRVPDLRDNCPQRANGNQRDTNFDGIGDACQG
ncbi:MAG: YncE family protein [Gammaproteobacteria bacterium]